MRRTPAPPLALLLCCGSIVGCGSSSHSPAKPQAGSVCEGAGRAAKAVLGEQVRVRVLARDPANLECSLGGPGVHVKVVSQANPVAWTAFNTEISHQEQVFGPGVHEPGQIPRGVTVRGATAANWIPAQRELVATSATPTSPAGAYVTVTVSGPVAQGATALSLAHAVATTLFATNAGASP